VRCNDDVDIINLGFSNKIFIVLLWDEFEIIHAR
jgi:hypothetical protein